MSRHARGSDSGQDADTVSRLHKLELMLSQQQQEFKLERMEWKTTTKALKENIETLRKAVATFKTEKEELRKDIEFLRLAQSALVEENRNLKDDVKVLHEKVEFMMHEHGTFEDDVHPLNETVKGVDKLSGKSYDGHQQVQSQTLKKSEELGTRTSQSRSHKVSLRSDDPGPSAAVIGQMKQQLTQVIAEVQMLKYDIEQQDNDIQESRGSTFVRWGSSTCPPSSQVVYSGVLGGSDTASLTGLFDGYFHCPGLGTLLCVTASSANVNVTVFKTVKESRLMINNFCHEKSKTKLTVHVLTENRNTEYVKRTSFLIRRYKNVCTFWRQTSLSSKHTVTTGAMIIRKMKRFVGSFLEFNVLSTAQDHLRTKLKGSKIIIL